VGARLDDMAVVQDDDLVGVAHVESRWAMVIVVRPRAKVPKACCTARSVSVSRALGVAAVLLLN